MEVDDRGEVLHPAEFTGERLEIFLLQEFQGKIKYISIRRGKWGLKSLSNRAVHSYMFACLYSA
jgi:hypothetical protein